MTAKELWHIKQELYQELEKSLEDRYQSSPDRVEILNQSIELIESFWLKAFIKICDNTPIKRSITK